jgi:hypothetical protein
MKIGIFFALYKILNFMFGVYVGWAEITKRPWLHLVAQLLYWLSNEWASDVISHVSIQVKH